MNDRFRFRVWNTRTKKLREVAQITLDARQHGRTSEIGNMETCHLVYQPHLVLEQCTGLKDKNGRLIYEGDIVRLTRRKDNILQKRGSCFQIRYLTHRFCGFGYGVNNRSVDMCLTERKTKCLEVIGNIHENPELLEAQNGDN